MFQLVTGSEAVHHTCCLCRSKSTSVQRMSSPCNKYELADPFSQVFSLYLHLHSTECSSPKKKSLALYKATGRLLPNCSSYAASIMLSTYATFRLHLPNFTRYFDQTLFWRCLTRCTEVVGRLRGQSRHPFHARRP